MNNYKYLFKNIGVLTLSNFATKFLSFFLVPLYTNVLTTTEYGTYDFFSVTITLMVPILTLNIMESSLRFSLDKEVDKNQVFTISCKYFVISAFIAFILLVINNIFNIIPFLKDYWFYFYLLFLVNAFSGIITCYVRGIDKIVDVSVASVISSIVTITLNIVFLLPLHMGLVGYFLSNIFGIMSLCLFLFVRIKGWRHIQVGKPDCILEKKMLDYSKPLIINSIAWWANSASSRYIVTWLCGMSANGIFSVGYKIPSILNIFQSIFNQAWTLSAVKDFDPEDKNGFFSNMYNSYNFLMVCICSILIIFDRFLASFLYAKDFYVAWEYVPFLLISIVFGALSGYIGGIFSALRNSKIFAFSTVVGGVVNIILSVILIWFIGPLGGAIGTAVSYWVVWLIRLYYMRKYMKIKLKLFRDNISYICLVIQSMLLLLFRQETFFLYSIESLLFLFVIILYSKELTSVIYKIADIFNKR